MVGSKQNDNRSITIYDIAKEAGVSPATVSRVLTSNANVRQEKKERILKLIEKYDFKPNALARGLSDTKSRIIGIIAADIRNPYYSELFAACEIASNKRGYTVLICNSFGETRQEEQLLGKLEEQRVDVIIQMGGRVDDLVSSVEYVEKVNQLLNKIPMVVTGKLDGTRCCQVSIDAMSSLDLLMEHLITLNHTRIALIGGRMDVTSTFEKHQRYKQLLARYKIEFRPEYIAEEGGYDYETGYDSMNRMLEKKDIPTAVIAINDFAAAGIIRSIKEHGFEIPRDISVVGYDNTYISELLIPKLTSVDYNYEVFGRMLVDTAIAAAEGQEVARIQTVSPTLVVRETSGIARNRNK